MKYLTLVLLAIPQSASAQLIQCQGASDCNFCALVATFHNLISLLMTIVVFFCVLLFIYTGFKLVTSGGNPSAKDEAKKLFTNTVVGFLIVLCSWTVVDVILKALVTNAEVGVWHTIDPSNCGGDRTAGGSGGGVTGGGGGTPGGPLEITIGGGGGSCEEVTLTIDPTAQYRIHDPADPAIGLPDPGPEHGHLVMLDGTARCPQEVWRTHVVSGVSSYVNCAFIRPVIPGCDVSVNP